MADYYSVLKKAVAGLQENTGSARRAVYQRARTAIVKQLKNYDPPLTPSQITEEQLKLEEAIRKVEAEAARESLGLGSPTPQPSSPQTRPTEKPVAAASPQAQQQPVAQMPQPSARSMAPAPVEKTASPPPAAPQPAAPQPVTPQPAAQQPIGQRPVTPPPAAPVASQPEVDASSNGSKPKAPERDVFKEAVKAAEDLGAAAHQANQMAREKLPNSAASKRDPEIKDSAPNEFTPSTPVNSEAPVRAAPEAASKPVGSREESWVPGQARRDRVEAEAKAKQESAPVYETGEAKPVKPEPKGKRARRRKEPRTPAYLEEGLKPSRMPQFLFGGALLLALLIGGFAVYTQKDTLLALFSSPEEKPAAVVAEPSGITSPETGAPTGGNASANVKPVETPQGKTSSKQYQDRMPADGQSQVSPEARAVTTSRITRRNEPAADNAGNTGNTPANGQANTPLPSATSSSAPAPTNSVPPAQTASINNDRALVAQQSILYEEAASSSNPGTASRGRVIWSLEDEAGTKSKSVKAIATLPERGFVVEMTIKPNDDDSLPASHLLELLFKLPKDFNGQGIAQVPGLILKSTEQAAGEPLSGASVKVAQNLFWIALSDAEEEQKANLEKLEKREWIDIPLLYSNGKRAILTFEKGASGNSVIAQAMKTWQ